MPTRPINRHILAYEITNNCPIKLKSILEFDCFPVVYQKVYLEQKVFINMYMYLIICHKIVVTTCEGDENQEYENKPIVHLLLAHI